MAEAEPTGVEIRKALGPLEAYDSFHGLLQALCLTRNILSYQALADALELDESLVKGWWTGSSRPGKGRTKGRSRRNDEILASFLGVHLDRHVLIRWNHLLSEARRRSKPNSVQTPPAAAERGETSEPDETANSSDARAKAETASAGMPDMKEEALSTESSAATSLIETEYHLSGGSEPSQTVAEGSAHAAPSTLRTDAPEQRQPSLSLAERLASLHGRKDPSPQLRLTAIGWPALAAGIAIVIVAGWMTIGPSSSDAGRQCDRLAAAPWDPARPPEIRGVGFEEIKPAEAREACRRARDYARRTPDEARYQFQLGRIHDRMGEYDNAFSDYLTSIELDPRYAAPHLNIGLLHDSGQISASSRSAQQPFRNPSKAAWRYEQAARLGLPWGRFCYALALLFGYGGRIDKVEAVRQLKLAQDAMRSGDPSPIKPEVDDLLEEIAASRQTTKHTVCERQNGVESPVRLLPIDPR